MKKFLSLMLAMIMVMSLVTVGAGAAFTDAEDIQYKEAVDLMTGLGILQGPGDGSFNPQGNLSRGAAAKIIAYIALGAEAADTMTYDEVIFPDVPTTSSTAPYIAWCAEQGIINGYTDGTFGRSNTVSGHAFLKMALTAIGEYGQYTGTGWQIRVLNAAKKTGINLLAGIDTDKVVLSDPLSREAACQIAFNAMKVNKAGVDGYLLGGKVHTDLTQALIYAQLTGTTVEPTYVYVAPGRLLTEVHKVVATPVTGVITENGANADTKFTVIGGENYAIETGLAQLGNKVTVYVKTGTYNATKGYTVISMTDACTEVAVTKATTKADLKAALAAAGITKNTTAVTVDKLAADGTMTTETVPAITLGTTKGEDLIATENETLTLVINNKEIVGVKAELAKSIEKIGTVTTTADKQTIVVGADTVKNGYKETDNTVTDKINAYEGIAKNDIVILTKIGDIYNVEKAQTVTGKPSKIGTNGTVTIDGVAYPVKGTDNVTLTNEKLASEMAFDKEYTLYLDGQGNYIVATLKATAAAEKTKVFFVDEYVVEETGTYGNKTYTWYAQAVALDGTIATYKIATATTLGANSGKGLTQRTYEISADSKGIYTFTATGVAGDTTILTTDKNFKADGSIYYYAEDVKFIAVKEDANGDLGKLKTEVRTGVQKVTDTTWYIATKVGTTTNYTVNTVIFAGNFDTVAETLKDVVYAVETKASTVKVPYIGADGKTAAGYEHTVYVDGVKTTIITNDAAALNGFIALTKAGEGFTAAPKTDAPAALKTASKVTNVYGTLITTNGTGANAVEDIDAANAEIIDLSGATTKVTEISKLKDKNVALVLDTTGTEPVVVTIYVVK